METLDKMDEMRECGRKGGGGRGMKHKHLKVTI